jgi:hypothetical protein
MASNDRDSSLQNIIGSTDTFAQISQLSLQYGTRGSSILAEAEPIQLYQACVANGLQDSFQEFFGEVNDGFKADGSDPTTGFPTGKIGLSGTVIRLMFGKDIAANGSLIPGVSGRITFSLRARVKNINYHKAMNLQLWVIPVYEGLFSLFRGTGTKTLTPIESDIKATAAPVSGVSFSVYEAAFGNGFFDTIGKIAKGVGSFIGMIPTPLTQGIGAVAKTIGSVLDRPKGPSIEVARPIDSTQSLMPTGAPVGTPFNNNQVGVPIMTGAPVGSPFPSNYEFYRQAKKTYRRAKRAGTATQSQRNAYRTIKENHRAIKRGRGIVASGLVNETTQGGKLASVSRLRRRI